MATPGIAKDRVTDPSLLIAEERIERIARANIKARRTELGLTTREVAARMQCSQPRYVKLETNEDEKIGLRVLARVAHVLKCDVVDLLMPKGRVPHAGLKQ